MCTSGSEYGPDVSYTGTGGFSISPWSVRVAVCLMVRIGTRMSGRLPVM